MPHCSNCNYWTRYHLDTGGNSCPNCEKFAEEANTPSKVFETKGGFLMFLGGLTFFVGMILTPWLGGAAALLGVLLSPVLVIFGMELCDKDTESAKKKREDARKNSPAGIFKRIEESLEKLNRHADEIQSLLSSEGPGPHTDRAAQRQSLLREALEHRRARIEELSADLWIREVQLWLNQLEGFLADELPKLNRRNAESIHAHFKQLVLSGRSLSTQGAKLEMHGVMPARAWRVLDGCLAKAPEFEDRVRDAQALAVLGEDCEFPPELEPAGSWLHWLQEAIPTIELLPPEFAEDEEYLRVQTQLRLLRDGVKYPGAGSLDRSANSLDLPANQHKFERE